MPGAVLVVLQLCFVGVPVVVLVMFWWCGVLWRCPSGGPVVLNVVFLMVSQGVPKAVPVALPRA